MVCERQSKKDKHTGMVVAVQEDDERALLEAENDLEATWCTCRPPCASSLRAAVV